MADKRVDRWSALGWLATTTAAAALVVSSNVAITQLLLGAAVLGTAQFIRVPTPSGNSLDIGLAVAAAVPLLVDEPAAVGLIYAIGLLIPRLIWLRHDGSEESRLGFLAATIGLAVYGVVFFLVSAQLEETAIDSDAGRLIAVAAAGLAWFVATSATRALTVEDDRSAIRYVWRLRLTDWPAVVGLVSAGALFGFTYPVMRLWAVPMAAMAYGFSHLAFVRDHGTRVTYGQTINALSRISEVAELTPQGHSARTAGIAKAIGRDLGLTPRDVIELEYGALMHDVGRIALYQANISEDEFTTADIAEWSADIVAEAPYLSRVATMIRQFHHPYRRPGEVSDESLPLTSKILRVAKTYDDAVTEMGLMPVEAVELLHRGAAYDYDPRIVRSLRRVVAHEGSIAY